MPENLIQLKSINDILTYNFFIPSYQRGYRWTEQQVTDLLDDIWEFSTKAEKKENEIYCLQPVVVKDNNGLWELIDGQQRLTTIFIILSYLKAEETYSIEFETRKTSKDFLLNLTDFIDETNVDFYHISQAFHTVTNWFQHKVNDGLRYIKNKFSLSLLESTEVIWYEIKDGSDAVDIFTRINIGKIPLTNAELIKALFLSSDNFENIPNQVRIKQIEIANEWDQIEYALQHDNLWGFLNKGENNLSSRIEFIFDLMSEDSDRTDDYHTFRHFNNKFKNKHQAEIIWKEVKDFFMTFNEWFNNRELYHLIGYLITIGVKIEVIKKDGIGKSKSEFREHIIGLIKGSVNYTIEELEYGPDNWKLTKVLLLFNIQTVLSNNESESRFSFNRYKRGKWSLEHIHAQNSEGLNSSKQWTIWLSEHKESLKRIDATRFADIIDELEQNNTEKITSDEFAKLFVKVTSVFKIESDIDELHDIRNLALLDRDSNSALNNSIFEVKRQQIIEREKSGSFIPICSRNVFLKYYSKNPSHLHYWGENDKLDYLGAIKSTLANFIPKTII
jgi:hypothetical protein